MKKRIFPTKEEYLAHAVSENQAIKDYLAQVQQAMMLDGEAGQFMGAMIGGVASAVDELTKLNEQKIKDKTVEKAQKIYGI